MPHHVVVDGSNLATEGRALPSLAQLNDAVMAFIDEHPDSLITVVVDATFGHRIDGSEVKEFDAAVANNEVVAPPAGAIGRGDAFLLSIANKVGATVLSNDSFQEFHGTYTWLFDEGRLIGGKPVPHIGWVFVARVPVRGPISRTAVKEAKRKKAGGPAPAAPVKAGKRQTSPEASRPMPVPKAPPPNARLRTDQAPAAAKPAATPSPAEIVAQASAAAASPAAAKTQTVNELMPFLTFVEHHPIGTVVHATVETYSSHGAYVRLVGDVVGYVPLRMMADPAPRSAREFMTIGDEITLVVESFAPIRRSIDLATVSMATAKTPVPKKAAGRRTKKAATSETPEDVVDQSATSPSAPSEPDVGETAAPRGRRGRRGASAAEPAETPGSAPDTPATDAGEQVDVPSAPTRAKRGSKRAATEATPVVTSEAAPPMDVAVPDAAAAAAPAAPTAPTRKRAAKATPAKVAAKATKAAASAPAESAPPQDVTDAASAASAPAKKRGTKKAAIEPAASAASPAAPRAPRRRRGSD
jgi:hypothetical protein